MLRRPSGAGKRAHEIGLVTRVVPPADLDRAIADITRTLLAKSPRVLGIGLLFVGAALTLRR